MNITICIPTMTHGGAQRVVSMLSGEFVRAGHNVELILYYDRGLFYPVDDKVRIVKFDNKAYQKNPVKHILRCRKYIKESKPDIVLSFLAPMNIMSLIATQGLKIPVIVADRNDPRRTPTNYIERKLRDLMYNFADGIVVQSKSNMEYFKDTIQDKSQIIFNPVDLGDKEGIAIRTEKKKRIVSVGRVIRQKNPMMLLKAFKNISDEFPGYSLTYYGKDEMREEILQAAEDMDIKDRVFLPGNQKGIFDHIKDATIFAMTSDFEGMPNALIEAMCLGLPVVSTKVSGAVDVINGKNGILVDCNDVDALTNALRRLLADEELRREIAEKAVELADDLRLDKIAHKWLEFIDKVKESVSK